ncbi:MAG: response regulator [Bacteroidetes bacterium]|nr:response regulator [Bacteroidota bacterium]
MKKILIVDDEPNIVMSLEYVFKKEEFEVFIARDAAEAIEIVENNGIDIIILDIMMPNIDGFKALKYLKADPGLSKIKIIVLSAKNKVSDIELGLQFGADKYVSKPFSTKKIVNEVKELLTKK